MDNGYVIIICFGMVSTAYTIIKIFASSHIKNDVKQIKVTVDKIDKTLFGSNGTDGMFTDFRVMQEKIVTNRDMATRAHKRFDKKFGRDQDSVDND